jgi:AraC family transcriptional regulator of adaptative response/methylated-DNA-[protein]-cysteine methyltransferase
MSLLQEVSQSLLDTPLGPMVAIANDHVLYLLEFVDRQGLEREVDCLKQKMKFCIIPGKTSVIDSIEDELAQYFNGTLYEFKTPIFFVGSSFQKNVWEALQKIPFGETRSYADIAKTIGKPTAFRAVALANSMNQFALVIPCHRVINSNGELGGYSGGISRKSWLLNHEKNTTM